jgi:hypothetical protein
MNEKSMKEKMAEAKGIYFERDFRSYMRGIQGFTNEDFERMIPIIKEKVIRSNDRDPIEMFHRILKESSEEWNGPVFPVHADWHHYLVPGVILAALRNSDCAVSDRDIEEAMYRGENFPGGSCGFAGTCGGAFSVGVVMSMINKTTPLHVEERFESMQAVIDTLNEIKQYPQRCCKRSSYAAIQIATQLLHKKGYHIVSSADIKCSWSSENKMCLGLKCPYFKKHSD